MLSNEYIAGFFDGEGYVTIRRANRYRLGRKQNTPSYRGVVGFVNTDARVLVEIQKQFGGKIYAKSRKSKVHKPAWELLYLKYEEIKCLVSAIRPFVVLKAERLDIISALIDLGKMKKRAIPRGKRWPLMTIPEAEVEVREQLKERLTRLNQRGVVYAEC